MQSVAVLFLLLKAKIKSIQTEQSTNFCCKSPILFTQRGAGEVDQQAGGLQGREPGSYLGAG